MFVMARTSFGEAFDRCDSADNDYGFPREIYSIVGELLGGTHLRIGIECRPGPMKLARTSEHLFSAWE